MIDCERLLKLITEKLAIVFLLIALCLVFLSQCYVYAETEAGAPSHSTNNVLESPQIDRIIPSKPDDLFVVLNRNSERI